MISEGAKRIFRVTSGNFLEMYDFSVFGFYASEIGAAFFPKSDPFLAVVFSLFIFWFGSLVRPLGGIVLGAYIDKHGRKKGLILTLVLMAIGTLAIALCPPYSQIGFLAPVIIIIGRLVQGFSAGAELGGTSIYLSEIAPKGWKGFYTAWQSGSQQIAVVFAGIVGVCMYYSLSKEAIEDWGWRIPFLIGCLIVPYLFYIRRSLEETEEYKKDAYKSVERRFKEMLHATFAHKKVICVGIGFVMMTTAMYYFITAFTPTYAGKILHFSKLESFYVTAMIGASNLFWLLVSGYLCDRIGHKPILLASSALCVFTAYPTLIYITHNLTLASLIIGELWLSFLYAMWNGTMISALADYVPRHIKALCFSFAYSVSVAIFGGLTPVISSLLIRWSNNNAIPGIWLSLIAACSLISVLVAYKGKSSLRASSHL